MEGQPVEEAKRAAQSMVEQIDLQASQIALVSFNSVAVLAQPLTHDRAALIAAIQRLYGEGGTAIDQALAAGRQALAGSAPSGRRAVLILLSDGGSDLDSAQREANQVRAVGIEIIAIGLRGTDFNETVLRAVAGNTPPIILDDPARLTEVFNRLAVDVTNPLVTDLSVREQYNALAFELADPMLRAAIGNPGVLLWEVPALSAINSSYQYVLRAKRIGWQQLSPGGQVAMRDCQGNSLNELLPIGPRILIIPSVPWLLGLWLLPLLLFLLALFLRKPPKRKRTLDPDRFEAFEPQPYGPGGVEALRPLADVEEPEPGRGDPAQCPPVLIMGAGDTARWVLTAVKRNLVWRYGQVPPTVRLLLIDFRAPRRRPSPVILDGVELTEGVEVVGLAPDFSEWQRKDKELPWKGSHDLNEPGRVRGRVALAIDFKGQAGAKGSPVWRAVVEAKQALNRPAVFVVASLGDEAGSGMAFDLADLAMRASPAAEMRPLSCRLLLGLPTAMRPGTAAENERRIEYALAALSELRRLSFRHPWSSVYGPVEDIPFDACYLFNGAIQIAQDTALTGQIDTTEIDLRTNADEAGPLSVVADWLTSVLDPAVYGRYGDQARAAATEMRQEGGGLHRALFGSFGVCSLQWPVEILRKAGQWWLIEQLVKPGPTSVQSGQAEVVDFLQGKGMANRHELLAWLADLPGRPWEQEGMVAGPGFFEAMVHKADGAFEHALAERLTRTMNEGGADGIQQALAFLTALQEQLKGVVRSLPDQAWPSQEDEQALVGWLNSCLRSAGAAEAELAAWNAALGKLANQARVEQKRADEELERWKKTRRGRVTEEALGGVERDRATENALQARLSRLRERLVWAWDLRSGQPRPYLLALPLTFDGSEKLSLNDLVVRYGAAATDTERVLDLLRRATTYHTRFFLTEAYHVAPRLRRLLNEKGVELLKTFVRESSPLLRYDLGEAHRILNQGRRPEQPPLNVLIHRVFASGDQEVAQLISDRLITERRSVVQTADPFTCLILSLASMIPLDAIEPYRTMVREAAGPRPDEQIFLAERVLARWQRRAMKLRQFDRLSLGPWEGAYDRPFDKSSSEPLFHPEFGTLVFDDGSREELFARAVVCNLIAEKLPRGWVLRLHGREEDLGSSIQEALKAFLNAPKDFSPESLLGRDHLEDTLRRLSEAVEQWKDSPPADLEGYLKGRLEQPPVGALRHAPGPIERSLWTLLRLIAEEMV